MTCIKRLKFRHMQHKIFLLLIFSIVATSFSFKSKVDFRPPGTVEIVDNFFYDEGEICNTNWREYLSYLEKNDGIDSEVYRNAMPDTTVWDKDNFPNGVFVHNYYSHRAYDYFPVVGVSHQQAVDYCTWRTKAVKIMLKKNNFEGPKSFEYRLPSKTEWELIANAGLSKKSKKQIDKRIRQQQKTENNSTRIARANLKYKKIEPAYKDDLNPFRSGMVSSRPAPSISYLPNKYGVYNIYGNVAEMITDPGIAMGGSYAHFYDEIVPDNKELIYNGPQKWLGFRCVCEIIEK